jgi:hypothetical protein
VKRTLARPHEVSPGRNLGIRRPAYSKWVLTET